MNNSFREYFTKEQGMTVRDQALKMLAIGAVRRGRRAIRAHQTAQLKWRGIIMPAAGDDVEKEDHSGRTSREDHAGKQSASFSQH